MPSEQRPEPSLAELAHTPAPKAQKWAETYTPPPASTPDRPQFIRLVGISLPFEDVFWLVVKVLGANILIGLTLAVIYFIVWGIVWGLLLARR